ncbi:MAG: hypothetical protein C4536_03075 [Actinobacteria bacterium]|nr:MAG: hypothetical protein C4536_03075 [Actinomycetota bacterium]
MGVLYFYDGSEWACQLQTDSTIFSITALDDQHVWACGVDGIWFYDGTTWTQQYEEFCGDIDAVDNNHIWAVGRRTVHFFDGHNWSPQFEASSWIRDVTAADLDHVWATGCGESGLDHICISYNGSSWTEQDWIIEEKIYWIYDISAADANDVWLIGADSGEADIIYRYDGHAWTKQYEREAPFSSITASDKNHVWATSAGGGIYFCDGASWSNVYKAGDYLSDIYTFDPNHVWAVGNRILFFDGTYWNEQLEIDGCFYSIHGIDTENVWAAGSDGVYAYDGEEWSRQIEDEANNIFVFDEDNVWTNKGTYSFDGKSWTKQQEIAFDDIDALSMNEVWLVVDDNVEFFDGSSQEKWLIAPEELLSISVVDPEHIWVVSRTWKTVKDEEGLAYNKVSGTIYFYDGEYWRAQFGTSDLFYDIFALDEDNIWATGTNSIYFGTKQE